MFWIGRVTFKRTDVSAVETAPTVEHTASLWSFGEVFGQLRVYDAVRVILARQRKRFDESRLTLQVPHDRVPEWTCFSHHLDVSNHVKTFLRSGQCNADTILGLQETNLPLLVAADE